MNFSILEGYLPKYFCRKQHLWREIKNSVQIISIIRNINFIEYGSQKDYVNFNKKSDWTVNILSVQKMNFVTVIMNARVYFTTTIIFFSLVQNYTNNDFYYQFLQNNLS